MRLPNLFIVGAPRSGTTALSQYLSEHPQVFFSNPKEPFYWCTDAPGLRELTRIVDRPSYMALFRGAGAGHTAIGEGSTEYLRSSVAIADILAFNPQARFIALVRNPVDLVASFHGIQLYTLSEDEPDFETAWRLQSRRSRGESLPRFCADPCLLQYAAVGQLGTQVSRFFAAVPAEQRRLFLFDDFVASPAVIYEQALEFLGIASDGRRSFPRVHESRVQRHGWLHRWVRRPPRLLAPAMLSLRRWMNTQRRGPVPWLKQFFSQPRRTPALSDAFRQELRKHFADEVQLLEELLKRDLRHWR